MEPGKAEMEIPSQLDRAPTEEIVEEVVSISLAQTNQMGEDNAMNWGSSLSLGLTRQIASDMGWGLSLSLGSTEQADPVLQPRVGSGNRRRGGPQGARTRRKRCFNWQNKNHNGPCEKRGVCAECGPTVTSRWRRGPLGAQTLCNACGIQFGKWKHGNKKTG